MTVVRRSLGYRRYVFSVQYHGSSFLGFSWQDNQENVILPDGTDLRGYRSVEGRLRQALQNLFPKTSSDDSKDDGNSHGFENFQVSSRTDRGVHALKNTLHVDLWNQNDNLTTQQIHRGVNFFLSRQREMQNNNVTDNDENMDPKAPKAQRRLRGANQVVMGGDWVRHDPMNEMRVLNVKEAPLYMANPGAAAANESSPHSLQQTDVVDWNARFSATQRTYMYRILHTHDPSMHNNSDRDSDNMNDSNGDNNNDSSGDHTDWAAPFEWDRSWRIMDGQQDQHHGGGTGPLHIDRMRAAAAHLQGKHDFSSFQASGCQRKSPVTTINNIAIHTQPYGLLPMSWERNQNSNGGGGGGGGLLGLGSSSAASSCQLVTILFSGNSFLYRQVRNMVSCLVTVGRGRLKPDEVQSILAARDRSRVPGMAPAHGLYLVDVHHGDFNI
jgi:tRNA U38,U39,U40 pseudouridine synthase TruA